MPGPSTFGQMKSRVAAALDIDVTQGDFPTFMDSWGNEAGRRVWEAREWFGRRVDYTVSTVAPYSTGTVAVSQGGTTLTGTATVWTTGMTGRKWSLGAGKPWYRFTYVSGTSGTISTYAEPTETAAGYRIFQDEFDLPTTAETIESVHIYSPRNNGEMEQWTEAGLDDAYFVNPGTGQPWAWAPVIEQTSLVRRFRVHPVPTDIYRLRVVYMKAWTELSGNDLSVLGANRERAWYLAWCLEAQRGGDARIVTSEAEVQSAIEEAYGKEAPASPTSVRRKAWGGQRHYRGYFTSDDRPFG